MGWKVRTFENTVSLGPYYCYTGDRMETNSWRVQIGGIGQSPDIDYDVAEDRQSFTFRLLTWELGQIIELQYRTDETYIEGASDLISVDAVKQVVTVADEFENFVTNLIAETIAEAESYIGKKLVGSLGNLQYFDGDSSRLDLAHRNVSNVVVYEDAKKVFDGDPVPSSSYTVYRDRGSIKLDGWRFSKGYQTVKVTYDGGYDATSFPKDLRRKLIKQIVYEFRRRNDPGLQTVQFPDGSISKFSMDEWLDDVRSVLDRFREIEI